MAILQHDQNVIEVTRIISDDLRGLLVGTEQMPMADEVIWEGRKKIPMGGTGKYILYRT